MPAGRRSNAEIDVAMGGTVPAFEQASNDRSVHIRTTAGWALETLVSSGNTTNGGHERTLVDGQDYPAHNTKCTLQAGGRRFEPVCLHEGTRCSAAVWRSCRSVRCREDSAAIDGDDACREGGDVVGLV